MKIFILNPKISSRQKSIMPTRPRQPLDLAYIAALLLKNNYEIKFLDANVLNYNVDKSVGEIRKYGPDILVLTSSPVDRWECPNSHIDSVFEIINKGNIHPTTLTGSHGSLTPEWIFKKCDVDYIVRNEPEITTLNLINALNRKENIGGVKGVSYRNGNNVINNQDAPRIENLDEMPFPAYELLPMGEYRYAQKDLIWPFSIVLTSRGCPFNCIFCLKTMSEGGYKVRNPKSVVDEIEYLIRNFNIKSIFFQDWEFTINKERVEEICDLILGKKLKVLWGCNSRANDLSDAFVKKMKEAGCVRINIGFESGSQKILDNANKQIKVEDLENAVKICQDNNINIGMYTMLNLPGENKNTIRETQEFFARNKIEPMPPNLAIPYFGTPLFEKLGKIIVKTGFGWDNIEKYAGRIDVKQSPQIARAYYRHFGLKNKLGSFYFFHPEFYRRVLRFIKNKIA